MQISESDATNRVTILSRGSGDMRLDIAMQDGGTHSVSFLGGRGRVRDRAGNETTLSATSLLGMQIAFVPTPAALSDLLVSARQIEYLGSETVNGMAAHHILVATQYSKAKDPLGILTSRSHTELFIDAQSSLLLKISSQVYDARGQRSSHRELVFSDYRRANGVLLPFSLTEISDGQKSWTIKVDSIEMNPKFVDKDFEL